MSPHLHRKTEYCYCCESVANAKCKHCGMPICIECYNLYGGYCDICGTEKNLAETGERLGFGMDYGYATETYD